jgi:hypothetical protein
VGLSSDGTVVLNHDQTLLPTTRPSPTWASRSAN